MHAKRQTKDTRAVIEELKRIGGASRRASASGRTSGRRGGTRLKSLDQLAKTLGTAHELALDLWRSGVDDARHLATRIADPVRVEAKQLDAWARDAKEYLLSLDLSDFTAKTKHAIDKADEWRRSAQEHVAEAGWNLVALTAKKATDVPDTWFEERLSNIERDLRTATNRVKHAMNEALIAIGLRNRSLRGKALVVAESVGDRSAAAAIRARRARAKRRATRASSSTGAAKTRGGTSAKKKASSRSSTSGNRAKAGRKTASRARSKSTRSRTTRG